MEVLPTSHIHNTVSYRSGATLPRTYSNETTPRSRHLSPDMAAKSHSLTRPEKRHTQRIDDRSVRRPIMPMATWRSLYRDDNHVRINVLVNKRGWTELDLDGRGLKDLPLEVFNFQRVEILRVSRNRINTVPVYIGHLRKLRVLDMNRNQIARIPETICNCTHLFEIDVTGNKLRALPAEIGQLKYMRTLKLGDNRLEFLVGEIGELENLKNLELQSNRLTCLPSTMRNLKRLKSLNIAANKFGTFPACISHMKSLRSLNVKSNCLKTLPQDVDNLRALRDLNLQHNQFETIPHSVTTLKNLTRLNVARNQLTSLPHHVTKLVKLKDLHVEDNKLAGLSCSFENLEYLNASGNLVTNCAMIAVKKLRYLNLNRNKLENMPLGVCNLSALQHLKLNHNRIKYLSKDVELLTELRVLDLGFNKLTELPQTINELVKLEYFNVKGNKITNRPMGVGRQVAAPYDNDDDGLEGYYGRLPKRHDFDSVTKIKQLFRRRSSTGNKPTPEVNRRRKASPQDVSGYDSWDSGPRNGFDESSTTALAGRGSHSTLRVSSSNSLHALRVSSDNSLLASRIRRNKQRNQSPQQRRKYETITGGYMSDPVVAPPAHREIVRPHHHYRNNHIHSNNLDLDKQTNYQDAIQRWTRHHPRFFDEIPPALPARDADPDDGVVGADDNWTLLPKGDQLQPRRSQTQSETTETDSVLRNGCFDKSRTDYTLFGLCNQLESLLQNQLLKPVISHRGNFARTNHRGTFARTNHKANGHPGGVSEPELPPIQSEQTHSIYPYSTDHKGSLLRLKPDKFKVTAAGGLFQCSLDPNIKVYFPVNAVYAPTDIIIQLEKVDQETLLGLKRHDKLIDNVISVGTIVHLWQSGNQNFNEKVLVTIPAPPMPQKGRIHVLTYRDDNTCTPCSSGFRVINGYITIHTWHFSGKGAVLTQAKCKYKACKSVERVLNNLYI